MPETAKQADNPKLFREDFHATLLKCRDACRGQGDLNAEMQAVADLVEMTHGRMKALEGHLRWADEIIGTVSNNIEADQVVLDYMNVDPMTLHAWREHWEGLKERQL